MTEAISRADVTTKEGRKYLVQLCKHFQHKRPATWGDDRGRIEFGSGLCELTADDSGLHIVATATEAENAPQLAGTCQNASERAGRQSSEYRYSFRSS